MSVVLEIELTTKIGSRKTLRIQRPKTGLTFSGINTIMTPILNSEAMCVTSKDTSASGATDVVQSLYAARYVTTTIEEIQPVT